MPFVAIVSELTLTCVTEETTQLKRPGLRGGARSSLDAGHRTVHRLRQATEGARKRAASDRPVSMLGPLRLMSMASATCSDSSPVLISLSLSVLPSFFPRRVTVTKRVQQGAGEVCVGGG